MSYEEDPSGHINRFLAASVEAARFISASKGREVSVEEVREALVSVFHVESQTDLLPLDLDVKKMVDGLRTFQFDWLRPIATVVLEESILPVGAPQRLDERQIKHSNQVWRIHKNDADPFPSNPHAHNVETGYKLHLGNGNLYRKREVVGTIDSKDLMAIRKKLSGLALPPLER